MSAAGTAGDKPWQLKYFGIGNETWGCGGNMRGEYAADINRRYSTFVDRAAPAMGMIKVASGPDRLAPRLSRLRRGHDEGWRPPAGDELSLLHGAQGPGPTGELLDELVAREADRLAESSADAAGRSPPRDAVTIRALGAFVAAGLVDKDEAIASLHRTGHDRAGDDGQGPGERLDSAIEQARTGKDYSSATATPRRDMNPALAERLGIDTDRALTASEVANLLNGQRADGGDIEGKQNRVATEGVGTVFGMDESRMPDARRARERSGRQEERTARPCRRKPRSGRCGASRPFWAPSKPT